MPILLGLNLNKCLGLSLYELYNGQAEQLRRGALTSGHVDGHVAKETAAILDEAIW